MPETKSQPESAPMSEAPLIEHPTHSLDDLGNILRASDSMRDLWAFVARDNLLLHWTGKYWSEDHGKRKMLKAAQKAVEDSLLDECDEIERLAEQNNNDAYAKMVERLDAWISESRQSKHINPLKMLPIWLERSSFSPSPDYLAFSDGTLRLKDCKFIKSHRPKDNLRAVIPHALDLSNSHKCLRWQSDEEAANQLQTAVRGNALLRKSDRKIVNAGANLAFRYPHNRGPPVLCSEVCNSMHNTVGATCNPTCDRVILFSDQG